MLEQDILASEEHGWKHCSNIHGYSCRSVTRAILISICQTQGTKKSATDNENTGNIFISMYGQDQNRVIEDIANSLVGFPFAWPWREPKDIAGDRIFGTSSDIFAPGHCLNCLPASYIGY